MITKRKLTHRALRTGLLAGLGAVLAACGAQNDHDTDNQGGGGWVIATDGDLNAFFDCLETEGVTLVSAHRGGPYPGYPENALETMAAVLERIPAIMEVDVAAAADGVHYLMHDRTLERTTNGAGDVDALDWRALSALRLEDNDGRLTDFAPTRFDDALSWAKSRTILQVDFKSSASYEAVADEIRRQDAQERVILIAYSMASARKLHRLLPDAMISLSLDSQSALNRAIAEGLPGDRLMGFTGTDAPRARLFSILNDRDVEVIFGTLGRGDSIDNDIARAGDEERYAAIAAQGVDIIATDRPLEAHAALDAAGRGAGAGTCGIARR